jgi:hypothetical protein
MKNISLLITLFVISSDNSPYLVQDNLTINNGVLLQVEAGVYLIRLSSGKSFTVVRVIKK